MVAPTERPLVNAEYRSLAEFRHALRRFLSFSERVAREHGPGQDFSEMTRHRSLASSLERDTESS